MEHPALAQVLQYVAGGMAEEDGYHFESHLGRCPDCAARVRAQRLLREHRASIFSARRRLSPAEAHLQARLRAFLADADLPSDLRKRLLRWSRSLFSSTQAALRIGLESATRRAWIRAEDLPRLPHGLLQLAFEPVPQPMRIRGKGQSAPTVVESRAQWPTRVIADAADGTVLVRHPKSAPPHPLILLISSSAECVRFAELGDVPGEPYLLARFEDVPEGEYTLLLQGQ